MAIPIAITDRLGKMAAESEHPLEQRMADLALWYFQNKDRIPVDNLGKRMEFNEKTMWILLEINALLVDRLRAMESNSRRAATSLWLPSGMKQHQRMSR
jgi:hypothetical protein